MEEDPLNTSKPIEGQLAGTFKIANSIHSKICDALFSSHF
jgi:hypothetical protein